MEHRKDKRFVEENNVVIKGSLEPREAARNGGINACTRDLSLSGARICSQQDFPVGSVIRIVIDLERTHQSLKVDGEVKWTRKSEDGERFEIGVEFLHSISQTLLSLIRHLYSEREGIPSSVS